MPAESFEAEFKASGFASIDDVINGRLEGKRLFRLVRQPRVQAAMIERSGLERETLLAFLKQGDWLETEKSPSSIWAGAAASTRRCITCFRITALRRS